MAIIHFCGWVVVLLFGLVSSNPTPNPVTNLSPSPVASNDNVEEKQEQVFYEDLTSTSTTKQPATNSNPESYFHRLDFISVIVICAIVAFCFGICVIVGCRRKKRHLSQQDVTDSQLTSIPESTTETRRHNLAYTSNDLRIPESPPPTYSIIERQTSFTSYVSQTSSHYEIPPDYDLALSFGDSTNGEPYSHRPSSRPGSRTSSNRSSLVRYIQGRDGLDSKPNRSESARNSGPSRSRAYRSTSDVVRTRKARLMNRPATVSEDDSSQCSVTTSAMTPMDLSVDDAARGFNIIADVSTSQAHVSNSECNSLLTEAAQPLLQNTTAHSVESDLDEAANAISNQSKETSAQRKLTLV